MCSQGTWLSDVTTSAEVRVHKGSDFSTAVGCIRGHLLGLPLATCLSNRGLTCSGMLGECCPSAGLGDLGAARGSCRLQGGWAAPGAAGLSYSTGSKVCQQSCGLAEAPAC